MYYLLKSEIKQTPGKSGKNTPQSLALFVGITSHAVKKLFLVAEKENWNVAFICVLSVSEMVLSRKRPGIKRFMV